MNNSLIWLLITVLLVQESRATCAEWKQLESDCGSYCFKVLRPVLDHTRALQSQVNDFKHQTESLTKVECPEKVILKVSDVNANRVEQTLEDLRRTVDIALLKQMESNIKQNGDYLGKFQNAGRQLEKIDALHEHSSNFLSKLQHSKQLIIEKFELLEKKLENQSNLIESAFQKQDTNLNSLATIEFIKQLQERIDLLEKNVYQKLENVSKITEATLQNHVADSLTKYQNADQMLQRKFDFVEKNIEDKLENISKLTENTSQKQIDRLIIQISNLTDKSGIVESLQKKFDALEAKIIELLKVNEVKKRTVKKPFKKIGSKYYYIENTEKLNWFNAAHRCLEYGGHLASIQNSVEFSDLVKNVKNDDYWIDINDLGTEGIFLSATTGLRPGYLNWYYQEPNNGRDIEHCGHLWYQNHKFGMNDADCMGLGFFICESENVN